MPYLLYCEAKVEDRIRRVFDYAFTTHQETHPGSVPRLEFRRITDEPFSALDQHVQLIKLRHGPRFNVLGFRIGGLAYCTDVSEIYEESIPHLQGLRLDYWCSSCSTTSNAFID